MKQFDLEKYLKNPSRKVVTRDRRSVRIICVNRFSDDYPIVALIRNKDKEVIECYTKDGRFLENKIYNCDLFFASEKKEKWVNVYEDSNGRNWLGENLYNTEKAAKADPSKSRVATVKIEWEE